MADKIYLNTTFALRSDTLENWQSINPILLKGEPAVVSDSVGEEWLKVGDGQTPWQDLPWKKAKTQITDQSFNPESTNAQSGKAVAEAIANIGGGGSPSTPSGTESGWEIVKEITVDPEVAAYSIYTNINGNPLEYDEFMIDITGITTENTSAKNHLIINLCKDSRTSGDSVVITLQMYDMIGTTATSYYLKTSKFYKLDKYRIECRGSSDRDWNYYTIPYTQKFKAMKIQTGSCNAGNIKVYGRKVV